MTDRRQVRQRLFESLPHMDYPPMASMLLRTRPQLVINDDVALDYHDYEQMDKLRRIYVKTTDDVARKVSNDTADAIAFCVQSIAQTAGIPAGYFVPMPMPERPTASGTPWNIKSGSLPRHKDDVFGFLRTYYGDDDSSVKIPFSGSVMEKWLKQFDDIDASGWALNGRSFMTELTKHWEKKDKMATKKQRPKKLTLTAARKQIKELQDWQKQAISYNEKIVSENRGYQYELNNQKSKVVELTSKLEQERLNCANQRGKIEGMTLVLSKIDNVMFKATATEKAAS